MAVTYITRIYATIDFSIDYIVRDKVVYRGDDAKEILKQEALTAANDYLENALDYIERDKTIGTDETNAEIRKTLTSVLNCDYDYAKQEFRIVREKYEGRNSGHGRGKNDREILGYHVWQSFEEKIDDKLSNEIGCKLAEELYGDFQCVVSTHNNTNHTHNHIVFNAVSFKDGHKYNICTANTRKLREVSDRLCREYGLHVLERTSGMNLTKYRDEDGNVRFFEKTDRKNGEHQGKFSTITDYRNYEAYEKSQERKEKNADLIRRDIDRLVPVCTSLDELIEQLENIGYEVKHRKVNGEPLKHISYKAPTHGRATREDALGEGYTRRELEKRIKENGLSKEQGAYRNAGDTSYVRPRYEYGKFSIEDLDEKKRKKYDKKTGTWTEVPRSEVERYVIVDTKILNKAVNEAYKKASALPTYEKKTYHGKGAKTQYHIDRINENLRALNFIEEKNLTSFAQINSTVQSLYDIRREIGEEFSKIKTVLLEMNRDVALMKRYNDLRASITQGMKDENYVAFELQGEKALLKEYENVLKKKNLLSPAAQSAYLDKVKSFEERFGELAKKFETVNATISEYDQTVYTINRIDREYDSRYKEDIKAYYDMRNVEKKNAKSNGKGEERN